MPQPPPTALVLGISGQDGTYLASALLDRGYAVHGTSRDREMSSFANLRELNIINQVHLHSAALQDFRNVLSVISAVEPTEIYILAAQSSVSLSFEQPVETIDSVMLGTLNVLEAVRFLRLDTKIYQASSGECFGNTAVPATEATAFHPCSPYGVAKAGAYWLVSNYRDAYGLFACSGILFNHESPLRPLRFVTRKIINGAIAIAEKRMDTLQLGNLSVARDWGWAPEYVEAMFLMLQQDRAEDFVIATGILSRLEDFVAAAFSYFGLDWTRHVTTDAGLHRRLDITRSVGNPAKARERLNWVPRTTMPGLVHRLIESELARSRR